MYIFVEACTTKHIYMYTYMHKHTHTPGCPTYTDQCFPHCFIWCLAFQYIVFISIQPHDLAKNTALTNICLMVIVCLITEMNITMFYFVFMTKVNS